MRVQGGHACLGGVSVACVDLSEAATAIVDLARTGRGGAVHLCNAYSIVLATEQPGFLRTLKASALNLPDGTPIGWYERLATGRRPRGPVRGASLMRAVLPVPGLRHFLLGATSEDNLASLATAIGWQFPEAYVAGTHVPPLGPEALEHADSYADHIRRAGADIVWLGLGTPLQDQLAYRLAPRVDAVLVCVGAAFDFLSGVKPEAPRLLHGTGLEWAFRLASEPRRLWRRYFFGNFRFLVIAYNELRRESRLRSTSIDATVFGQRRSGHQSGK